jgi:hypothetical protein
MQQKDTESVRIPTELMDKIRKISKENGQSYKGYITTSLYSVVNKDYEKILKKVSKNATKINF